MNYDSLIRVVNNEPPDGKTYRFAFNSQRWTLKPGQQNYLPFDAVVRSMGDPRSAPEPTKIVGQGGRSTIIPSRTQELQRLSVLYGIYGESINSASSDGHTLLDMIPNITGFNMEDSEQITFPHMDPDCTNMVPDSDDISQNAILFREMEKMRRQMMVYEEILKQQNPQFAAESDANNAVEVDEDSPQPVRRPVVAQQRPAKTA